MQSLLKTAFLVIVLFGAGFYFYTYDRSEVLGERGVENCTEPLTFRMGSVDPRFGISESEALEAMKMAASLWSEVLDRPLAIHDAECDLVVNFEYDERQEMVMGEIRFRDKIESEQFRMDQLQREYDYEKEKFDERSEEYRKLADYTRNEIDRLNSWARSVNGSGGFTPQKADNFEQQREEVERLQKRVLEERQQLDTKAARVNQMANRLNDYIQNNNRLIDQYNEEFSGENRFAKATYQRVGNSGIITVNQFINKRELYLVLAHELGHALGLGHGENPQSIMHSQMGGQEIYPIIQLSREDVEMIKNLCR
jgi:hypothetical protein